MYHYIHHYMYHYIRRYIWKYIAVVLHLVSPQAGCNNAPVLLFWAHPHSQTDTLSVCLSLVSRRKWLLVPVLAVEFDPRSFLFVSEPFFFFQLFSRCAGGRHLRNPIFRCVFCKKNYDNTMQYNTIQAQTTRDDTTYTPLTLYYYYKQQVMWKNGCLQDDQMLLIRGSEQISSSSYFLNNSLI